MAPAALALAVSMAYSNSLHGEFIFDDHQSIPGNPSIRQLWPLGDVLFPEDKGGRTVDARPVVNLSLAINYALGGLDVRGYHVFNLLVHIAATLTLYGVVRRTLLLPRWSGGVQLRATPPAFLCGLLWGLHPLQTESVTYLIQRAESMAGLFYLLTLYAAIRSYNSRFPAVWNVLGVAACALGMGTKEVVATAPLVILLYDRVFLYPAAAEMLRERRWLYVGLAGTWLVLLLLMAAGQGRGATVGFSHGVTPVEYLLTQCWAIPHYVRLAIVPYPLVLDYGNQIITEPARVLPGLLVLAGLVIGTAVGLRFQPWIGFLGSCFFLILAPSSSFVPIVTQTVAEHRMYLPLAAVLVFVVIAVDRLWRRRPLAFCALGLAVAVVFGLLTWQRNADYRTAESIWRDTMAKSPGNIRTHANMADVFLAAGNAEAAIRELDICVQMKPESAAHRYNRGTLKLRLNRYDEAIEDYNEALELNPADPEIWHNRGVAWQGLSRHDLAIADFTASLERNPQLAVAYQSRAISYHAIGQLANAEADLQRFLALGGKLEPQ
jgi:tetratricopeptide (TPR) repeat protein